MKVNKVNYRVNYKLSPGHVQIFGRKMERCRRRSDPEHYHDDNRLAQRHHQRPRHPPCGLVGREGDVKSERVGVLQD